MTDKILGQNRKEKMLLISIVGTLEAIREGALTINESEKYLFSPRMIKQFRDEQYQESILDILEKCCELEDIESLIPDKLDFSIRELEKEALEALKGYQKCV